MNIFRIGILFTVFILLLVGNRTVYGNVDNVEDDKKSPSILDYRLPGTIIPVSYEIILTPLLENDFQFEGHIYIKAFVQEATDTITLHRGRINITMMSVTTDTIKEEILDTKYNDTTEKIEIKLQKIMEKGLNISINFNYLGTLRDDMIGFYKSSYIDSTGKIRWLASTQFQTTHARHAFPCFDEPSFKATFTIRILKTEGYTCLSNMPHNRTIEIGMRKYWEEFKQSIPMSTYLVAFMISDFAYVETNSFKVWARPNAIDQTRYALSIGPQALDYLSKLFKQEYQISKMDMVAVPDFSAGAMENWGLITYRENRLLYDESVSSDVAQQSIASVIVHELTHMWFGNLITPEWWSYLWLSEAFARYYQYYGTAQIEKSWNMEEQFLVEQFQTALAVDGLESSQPMTRDVSNSAQMSGIGDTITYNKGASIVRMMSLVFGQDIFETGLQNYLKNNKENRVARPENLWEEFQAEINRRNKQLISSVDKIMSTWTKQSGFPILHVSIQKGIATIRQQRFLLRNLKVTPTNRTWWVPITWTSEDNPNFDTVHVKYWLNKEESQFELATGPGWVILNVQSAGFYRVTYDKASWYRIIDVLNSKNYQVIHVLNRAALIDDLLNLARAGLLLYKTALDGLQYIKQETNYLPFKSAFSGLTHLDQHLSGYDESYEHLKKYVLILLNDRYEEIGYLDRPNDDRLTVLLRSELNKWACYYGHERCVETFTQMFQQWRANKTLTIKPNQRAVAYCTAIKHGTKNDWEFLWDQYFNSNYATEQSVILQALGCTENNNIRKRYLLYALASFEENRIRKQDSTSVFSAVYGSGVSGAEFVLDFIDQYHANMTKYYNGTGTIASILSSASLRFSTQNLVDKFQKLIETHELPFVDILDSLRNSLEIAKYELGWFKNFKDPIMSEIIDFNNKHSTRDTKDYLLPTSIIPNAYVINVTPHINESDNFTFDGEVNISAAVEKETNSIILHSAEIAIHNVVISVQNNVFDNVKIKMTEKYNFLTIELAQKLQVGTTVTIRMKYTGYLNEEMRGFYRSSYVDDNGKTRWLASTHMEPVAARKMFPCFDEPALKATFKISVTVPKGYNAISNMPIENSILHDSGETTIIFKETPKMSTYLVALVVSDFTPVIDEKYKVWARPNAVSQGKFALSIMGNLVSYYEDILKFPYQLPKLDMVALPDFASGAMENWGLLTYKERNVLYDDNESTITVKQIIANVISHEISHQWFGNLVTPLWWKYIWLNEGFARYYQYFGTANVMKDWSLESQFVVDQLHSALESDSSTSSHAMTHDVYSPTEIKGMFDTISYAKGASVIRMLRQLFGPEVFHKSLQSYLNNRRNDVAKPEHLFDAFKENIIDETARNSFHDIMNTWTTQPGYPVIHFSIQNQVLHLRQERFFIEPKKNTSPEQTWYVPITWTSLQNPNFDNTTPKYWFQKANDSIPLPDSETKIFIFNVQQTGFYRTNYDDNYWRQIINFLKTESYNKINEINRAAIIDDLMNLGRAGYVDYEIVLSATQYLTIETNYVPWRAFFNGLTYLRRQFQGREAFNAYKRYINALVTPIYNLLKFEDQERDTHETKLLRTYVRKWACDMGVANCESVALSYFTMWQNGSLSKLPPNYRSVSYCTVARMKPFKYWKTLWELYLQATVTSDKSVILQSLACTTETSYLNMLLEKAITKDFVIRFEDSASVFSNVIAASLEGVDYVMDFVKNNYTEIVKYYKDVSTIKTILNALGKRLSTDELYKKYIDLVTWLGEKDTSFKNSLDGYKSRADHELSWAEKYIPKIHEWIEINYPDPEYRLPLLYAPRKYNISLTPYFEEKNFTFSGNVQITMNCLRSTSRIVVNSRELKINKVSVYKSNSNSIKVEALGVSNFVTNKDTQMLTVFMEKMIKSDEIIIDIEFTGFLNDRLEGFYRSYYFNSNGDVRWLATTQFEPIHARSAFPCFDEPAFKATFEINIERPKKYIALSNMPSIKVSPSSDPDREWTTFKETVKMSSYLVAFTVCDFQTVRNPLYNSVNVWGRPDIAPKGDYAQIAAMRMLDELYMTTGIKYALPKLDLIGIPDFSMGAMENWGLATFREYGLFYDESLTTAKSADYILTIIAHELAHMWYGNLVTCEWWEYIWLNEGFAEYMQWQIANSFKISHGFKDLFVVDELQVAMQNDDYKSSHPMNYPVSKSSEIVNIFDSITYGKSSSVIRMIHNSLEGGIFSLAMHQYLIEYQYNNTTPKDLWKVFDRIIKEKNALNISMETLMNSWTNEAGYPVVFATLNNNIITLTQKRFSLYQDNDPANVYFWIPITIASASNVDFITTKANIWLERESLDIHLTKSNEWFLLNVQQSGYYRVNYDTMSWLRLIEALHHSNSYSSIHVTNRAQIIDDLLNLARGKYVDYNLALNGTTYLLKELDYLPWKAFFNGMSFILQRYEGHEDCKRLQDYILHITSEIYKQLDFTDLHNDKHWNQLSRELILTWNCKFDDTKCVDASKDMFANWRQTLSNKISPNARPAVYCTAMRYGSKEDWHFLWNQYLKTDFASEKKIMLNALGCTKDKDILQSYIKYALNSNYTSNIRKQDVSAALSSIYNAGQFGLEVMLEFLLNDYEKVYEYYGEWESVGALFSKLASRFSTTKQIDQLKAFIQTKKESISSISSVLTSAITTAEKNYNWYERSHEQIDTWLDYYYNKYIKSNGSGRLVANSFSVTLMTVFSIIVYIFSR